VDLQFCFAVPTQLPQSEASSDDYHYWKVVVEGDQSSIPYSRAFEIPVFPTAQTAQYLTVDSDALAAHSAQQQVESALDNAGVAQRLREKIGLSLEVRADWMRLYFHRGRQKMMAMVLLTVGLAFLAVFWLPENAGMGGLFRWVFGLAGLGMTLAGLYVPFNTLDVRINRQRITRIRTWFGINIRQQEISPQQLQDSQFGIGDSRDIHVGEPQTKDKMSLSVDSLSLVSRE